MPPVGILLSHVNISGTGRNGVGITGGNYIRIIALRDRGHQPCMRSTSSRNLADADIHNVTVERSSMRRFGAVGTYRRGGRSRPMAKPASMSYLTVISNRATRSRRRSRTKSAAPIGTSCSRATVSSVPTHAYFTNVDGLTFSGNVRIVASKDNVS